MITSVEELKNFLADVNPTAVFSMNLCEKWGKDEFDPEKHRDEICWSTDDIIAGYGEEFSTNTRCLFSDRMTEHTWDIIG